MIKKKVCMIGAFAAGKSSLVQRFAHGVFSERYLTTVGVRIEKKAVEVAGAPLEMILWDLHGEDEFQRLRLSYLKGSAGFIYVVDGTRAETAHVAVDLKKRVDAAHPGAASVVVVNKRDLVETWELSTRDDELLRGTGAPVLTVSAKTGELVEEAFTTLGRLMLEG